MKRRKDEQLPRELVERGKRKKRVGAKPTEEPQEDFIFHLKLEKTKKKRQRLGMGEGMGLGVMDVGSASDSVEEDIGEQLDSAQSTISSSSYIVKESGSCNSISTNILNLTQQTFVPVIPTSSIYRFPAQPQPHTILPPQTWMNVTEKKPSPPQQKEELQQPLLTVQSCEIESTRASSCDSVITDEEHKFVITFPVFGGTTESNTGGSPSGAHSSSNSSRKKSVNRQHNTTTKVVCFADGTIMDIDENYSALTGLPTELCTKMHIQYIVHPNNIFSLNLLLVNLLLGYENIYQQKMHTCLQRADHSFVNVDFTVQQESEGKYLFTFQFPPDPGMVVVDPQMLKVLELKRNTHKDETERAIASFLNIYTNPILPTDSPGLQPDVDIALLADPKLHAALFWLFDRLFTRPFVLENAAMVLDGTAYVLPVLLHPPGHLFYNSSGTILWANRQFEILNGCAGLVGHNIKDIELNNSSFAGTSIIERIMSDQPEVLQVRTSHSNKLGFSMLFDSWGSRLDTKEFYKLNKASGTTLNPSPEQTYGFLWFTQPVNVEYYEPEEQLSKEQQHIKSQLETITYQRYLEVQNIRQIAETLREKIKK